MSLAGERFSATMYYFRKDKAKVSAFLLAINKRGVRSHAREGNLPQTSVGLGYDDKLHMATRLKVLRSVQPPLLVVPTLL